MFSEKIKSLILETRELLTDDSKRLSLQFSWLYSMLTAISFFMSVVNLLTGKYVLLIATLSFSVLTILNILLSRFGKKGSLVASSLFSFEIILLFTFFIISGMPEGFSAIWICLLPASGLLVYKKKRGTILCGIMLLILIVLFQTPFGESILQYQYTESFKLRFPMLYIAFFLVSFLLETIRSMTYEKLMLTQKKYEYLYSHDALTDVYNRYGFNEKLNELLASGTHEELSLMIVDIDYFKSVNDRYGHSTGDEVLREFASLLSETTKGKADVCRWGGEEFALLYFGKFDIASESEQLVSTISNTTINAYNQKIHITASIGAVSISGNSPVSAGEIVSIADSCLYKAKDAGRNTSVCTTI